MSEGAPAPRCECGATLAAGARFCSACGARVGPRCNACGAKLAPADRFCSQCGAEADGPPAGAAADRPRAEGEPPSSAERRQVTLAFCDMVGSTEHSRRLDPEDMRGIIQLQRERCAAAVRLHEGHVLRHLGDGVLICFGYPEAHEDDAARAVRAALDLQQMIADARHRDRYPTEMRIGIATGLVVTGDMDTGALDFDLSIVGDAPNLAARLQALAPPGGIVVASLTRRLIGDLFVLEDLGPQTLKGFEEPQHPALVLGTRRAGRAIRMLHGDPSEGLAGRTWESDLVGRCWQTVLGGSGQAVLIGGEAGIGKSRLVETALARAAGDKPNVLRLQCQTHHRNTAFAPVIEELDRRVSGRDRLREPEARLKAVRRVLGPELGADDTAVTLTAQLLGISTEALPKLGLTPQQQRARTQDLMVQILQQLPARRPLVLIIEDCHWIDASSGELLTQAVAAIEEVPVLLLATGRPEFRPDWIDQPHVVALSLGRLDRSEAQIIVANVAGKPLPDEVVDQILSRTDGVPLFVEELTKTVLESGQLEDDGDRYVLRAELPRLAVPETLRDSLTARLDRLGPARRIAQLGAMIGREFRYDLLEMVADAPQARLTAALDELCASGLVSSRGTVPDAVFTFKHALVQDTAARSMLRRQRTAAHARIAAVMLERFPDLVRQRPELVAQHYEEAGDHENALEYFERAGRATLARSNYTEGIGQLRHAQKALAGLPEGPEREERELNLLVALGGALIATRGYAAPEPGEVYNRAVEICRNLPGGAVSGPVYYGLSVFRLVRAEIPQAVEIAQQFKKAADEQHDADLQLVATRALGVDLTFQGRWEESERHLRRALDLYDPARHRDLVLAYAQDLRIASLAPLSWCAFFTGRLEEAQTTGRRAIEEAVELKHLHSLAYAHGIAGCMLPQFRGDIRECRRGAEALLALSKRQPIPIWTCIAICVQGWAIGANGDLDAGARRVREGIAEFARTGARLFLPYYTALIADIHLRNGERPEARRLFAEAQAIMDERPEGWFAPEL
ncbi:MAG TPA: AAA family ATPase, partial [Thermohalobaculum sp.]|nr:AAA family ATPase [Thermohalobaculum sp.]